MSNVRRPKMPKKPPSKQVRPGVDPQGRTLLHYAANEGRLSDVELLLQSGADPNAKDDSGWTPLHFAVQSDSKEVVALLLGNGAEVDAIDLDGNSPLFKAVFAYRGEAALILALRKAGADPAKENNHGVSPVSLARSISNYDVKKHFGDLA
jgi:uncharacterized protein